MFKSTIVAILAVASLLTAASASAEPYRCTEDSRPANPGTGKCDCPSGIPAAGQQCPEYLAMLKKRGMSVPQTGISGPQQQQQQTGGTPVPVRPYSPSEMDNLKQVLKDEMRQQMPAPRPTPTTKPVASNASAAQQQQQKVEIVIQAPDGTRVSSKEPKPAPTATDIEGM